MGNKETALESIFFQKTRRKRVQAALCGVFLLLCLVALCAACSQNSSEKRVHEMLSYIEANYDGKFGASVVKIDDEQKEFVCDCGGPKTIQSFDRIRILINEYLTSHPEFFLNKGYSITVNVKGGNAGPVMAILTNRKVIRDEESSLYDELSSMWIVNSAGLGYKISQIKGSCTTLRAICLDGVDLDDLEVLHSLPLLESIDLINSYTKEDIIAVQNALPNCNVY